uniref:non-specific serine/threonine protein kinase n=1 Tax=Strongyloides venezuelensis TaxID=75913 RepID=A0A0K0G0Y0_STRVS
MTKFLDERPVDKSPNGRFLKFDEKLDEDNLKTVYLGLDIETGIDVAWFEFKSDKPCRGRKLKSYKEVKLMLWEIKHPNIVEFYDCWEAYNEKNNICLFVVTELMTSGTLTSYIKKFQTVSIEILKHWGRQILLTLNYLHTRNPPVVHRYLTCDNIYIVETTGNIKIDDLYLSTLDNSSPHFMGLLGTLAYLAPEVYNTRYDEAVDVYAFGMCLLTMVTGEYLYSECSSEVQTFIKASAGKKPDCFYKIPEEYGELKDIIDKCLMADRDERITVSQLLSHDFFAPDDQSGVKIEIKNKEEDLMKYSSLFQMELRITDPKKRTEYNLNEDEGLHFYFDYLNNTVEDLLNELIEQNYVLECNREILTKKIECEVNLFIKEKAQKRKKISETNDENLSVISSSISSTDIMKNYDYLEWKNTLSLLTDNCCKVKDDDKIVMKNNFAIKTVNITPNTVEQVFNISDISNDITTSFNMECNILGTEKYENTNVLKPVENKILSGKTDEISKIDLTPFTDLKFISNQNFGESQFTTSRCSQYLSREQKNMSNGQIGSDLKTAVLPSNSVDKIADDSCKQQCGKKIRSTITLTGDSNIQYSNDSNNLPHVNRGKLVRTISSNTSIASSIDSSPDGDRSNIKNLKTNIRNMESDLKNLSGTTEIPFNFGGNLSQSKTLPEDISKCRNSISDNHDSNQQNNVISLPMAYTKKLEPRLGYDLGRNADRENYLDEMIRKRLALLPATFPSVVESKTFESNEQYNSRKESIQTCSNCSIKENLNIRTQEIRTNLIENQVSQLQIQNMLSKKNEVLEHLHSLSDQKKILPETLSDKLTHTNGNKKSQQSDTLPYSQTSTNDYNIRGYIDEIDGKLDSNQRVQKVSISSIPNNERKNSLPQVFDDKSEELSLPNKQFLDKTISSTSDVSSEETLRKSSRKYDHQYEIDKKIKEMLNAKNPSNSLKNQPTCLYKNSSYSCHSPEHHSIIEVDINVIDREIELYKLDKLVFDTLQRHKKELLELRTRQCTELREIKHLSTLMTLKTQELLRQLYVENEDNLGK